MVYMGSKNKYCPFIVPIIQKTIDDNNIKEYIEFFVGGANVIDKIECDSRIGYDRSKTLIALLDQASKDFSLIPENGNREMWDKGKSFVKDGKDCDLELYEIGAIEFLGSFSNGGFPRGYAKNKDGRNYYQEAYRNLEKQAPNLKDIIFKNSNYEEINPKDFSNKVIYLDPPYQNTKKYGYTKDNVFNYEHFWNWVRELSKNNIVFISEQYAPKDFEIVWEKDVKRTCGKTNDFKATEKLFRFKEIDFL